MLGIDISKLIISQLPKDAEEIPSQEGLVALMRKIDEGVKKSGWDPRKRATLMSRIEVAAKQQGFEAVREMGV